RLVRLRRPGRVEGGVAGGDPGAHLRPEHQPDGRRVRGEGPGAGGGRGRHELRHRHGRDQRHAVHPAGAGPKGRLGGRHLRRHQPDVQRVPPPRRRGGDALPDRRSRRHRGGDRRRPARALPGEPDQPDVQGAGPRPAGRPRPVEGGDRGGRQHVRHAHQPAPAGAGRPSGPPQRDQVPGGPRRRLGGRGRRRQGPGRVDLPPSRDHRRDPPPGSRLPPAARDEDPGPARGAAERQRDDRRPLARGPSRGRRRLLPRPGMPPRPRRGEAADAGGLRRRLELPAPRRFRRGEAVPAAPAVGAPGGQPGGGGDRRRAAGHRLARRADRRRTRRAGHPRDPRPLLLRHRGRGRPDRRPGAGAGSLAVRGL
ncbi:hypothetical protein HK102_012396, partial [Quaeritorhiza haematococci]